jgi:hypothetical protein
MNPQTTHTTSIDRAPVTPIGRGPGAGQAGWAPVVRGFCLRLHWLRADRERDSRLKTKPNEANWVNSHRFSEMRHKFIKRSQTTYPACFQSLATRFRPFFRKNECDRVDGQGRGKTNPNEAKPVNPNSISEMREKFIKRSQPNYPGFFQILTRILGSFFEKNECDRPNGPGWGKTKPNEAKRVKPNSISEMREKFRKRSQMSYPYLYHRLAAEKGPDSRKNEWAQDNPEGGER